MAGPELYFEKFLGKGSFGSVSLFKYKGRRDSKTLYAAAKTSDDKHAESLYREYRILSKFKGCPRIVQCYGTKVQETLNVHEGRVEEFTRMLLEGLATIHRNGYVHCDLKPGNILVFPSCSVNKNGAWSSSHELKISDFGLSRRDGDRSWWKPRRPFAGTPIYMSPKSISHGETGRGLDLWSLGCVVLEMYTGKKPWWHKNYDLEDLKNCHEPLIPRDLPCDAKLFIMTCFALDVEDRKDASTLLRHTFLRGEVTEPLVNVKTGGGTRKVVPELEKIRQRLSEIRSICV
ncbi:unnamed protein product [Thlaspi arvense]|uniref:Protein kinase domain-containing protein n=1 Tax=Thlaspi arvense TaxID=13288 RepID=A0AAU9SB00_THLAR|nr:unnamed protein product [Thlaspi arvense]